MSELFEGAWHRLLEFAAVARADGSEVDAEGHHSARAGLERTIAGLMDPLHGDCYGGIVAASLDGPLVIAQIGQSLDGRIATHSGHSHYINGPEALDHLHRLRALCDAVIIGASTAILDDPKLTTRRVEGPNPARVVLDPTGRVPVTRQVLSDADAPSLLITTPGIAKKSSDAVERIELETEDGHIPPAAILAALGERGLNTVLVEGGAHTVSRFIAAGVVDRLHVLVAPLILGSGRPGIELPAIDRVDQGTRPATRIHRIGTDVLFDCDLRREP
jgi:diaminohydroxyphosphoribosylaminopyrimidine deaminase / 5-amino-6-(5-phosphoribosylamino)uracil reductase